MPQLILLALAGVGAYATYKWASKKLGGSETKRAGEGRAKAASRHEPRDLGSLKRDPDTGEYRPN